MVLRHACKFPYQKHVAPHADDVVIAHKGLCTGVNALNMGTVVPNDAHQADILGAERPVEIAVHLRISFRTEQ